MVDEKDEAYDGQEEGEYHFSDEHANYEMETETAKVDTTAKSASAALSGLTQYRRMIIIGIVAFVALLAVYRLLMPSYTPQPTDFTQATPTQSRAPVQLTAAPKQPTATAPVMTASQAAPQQLPQQQVAAGQTPELSNSSQVPGAIPQNQTLAPNQNPAQEGPQSTMVQAQQQGSSPSGAPQQPGSVSDRVAALEEQNAKLTNLLQIEYAQKMSDYASDEAAMQSKILELNNRVASMEAVINQLNQLLQGTVKPAASSAAVSPQRTMAQRISYVVQAIIPGRAWLKSDSGDTVTVAEGDSLKGYGRITKIDPYDGIVTIDTGSKTITLSYGMGADS